MLERAPSRTDGPQASEPPRTPEPAGDAESRAAAEEAGLRYVNDRMPGIRRVRQGRGVRYVDPDGSPVRDRETLERIRALAVPPAWRDVWISTTPRGHIQAVGRDARGRKQYRYHARWRAARDETKFGQLIAFGHALPALRRRVARDLARRGIPRERVLATVVRLLETTLARIGNEEYARENGSFGLTTLRDHHVRVSGARLEFRFTGKSGKPHALRVDDRRLAGLVKACQSLPGRVLFQYLDDQGQPQSVDSGEVNAYLREISGADFTAKLFRTWAGTVRALVGLRALEVPDSRTDAKRAIGETVKEVAASLRNTPAVCRKSYIHPALLEDFEQGELHAILGAVRTSDRPRALSADERLLMAFLVVAERRARRAARRGRRAARRPTGAGSRRARRSSHERAG